MTVSLVSGETSLTITGVPPLMPHVQTGRMRGIAVASTQRLKVLPDLPGPSFEVYFIYPSDLKRSKRIAAFRQFLIDQAASWEP